MSLRRCIAPRPAIVLPDPTASPRARDGACLELRARERVVGLGPTCLGEVELVAAALGGARAHARASELLAASEGLAGLLRMEPVELARALQWTPARAAGLVAALELGRRAAASSLERGACLRAPDDVARYLRATLGHEPREVFVVVGVDARQRVRLQRTVAVGTLAQVDVHPRDVFRPLLRAEVHAAIVAHNHPSGDPSPSDADVELTRRLAGVGRLVGVPLLDHLVVTPDAHVSLASLGLVPSG